jgi:hypothetical protein
MAKISLNAKELFESNIIFKYSFTRVKVLPEPAEERYTLSDGITLEIVFD